MCPRSGAVAAAATVPVTAAAQNIPATGPTAQPLVDPRTKYARPPYPEQPQPWPGLASKMTPRPDHGETSYKGSGRLLGRKALITGGDSGMGRAAAIAYAREGADVAINYLPAEEPDAREVIDLIRKAGRKAVAIPGDLRDENFCKSLVNKAVAELGGLDILVSNAARQHAVQSILDMTTELFDWTIKTNIYAPFWIIREAIPHMPPGATIIATYIRTGLRPQRRPLRLRPNQGRDHELRQVARQAAGQEGAADQRRRPRPHLDTAPGLRRRHHRALHQLRRQSTRSNALASQSNWPRSTSNSPHRTPATPPATSTAPAAAWASRK